MFPTMLSYSAIFASLVGAATGCNLWNAPAAIEQTLYWADAAIVACGVIFTLLALKHIRANKPASIADDAAPFPPEAMFLPVVAYLGLMLVSYPVFAQFLGTIGPEDAADEDKLDIAALVANNLAFVGGAVACYFVGRRIATGGGSTFVTGNRPILSQAGLGVVGGVIAIALCQLTLIATVQVVEWVKPGVEFPEHGVINALRNPECPVWLPIVLWIGVLAATPIAEEMFFRGLLLTGLVRATRSKRWGVVIAGLLFGMAHASQPQVVPALSLFGIILCIMYLRSGSLIGPIIAHAVFNGKTLVWELLLGYT